MSDFGVAEGRVWQHRLAGLLAMVLVDSLSLSGVWYICGDGGAKDGSRWRDSVYLRAVSMPVDGNIQRGEGIWQGGVVSLCGYHPAVWV